MYKLMNMIDDLALPVQLGFDLSQYLRLLRLDILQVDYQRRGLQGINGNDLRDFPLLIKGIIGVPAARHLVLIWLAATRPTHPARYRADGYSWIPGFNCSGLAIKSLVAPVT